MTPRARNLGVKQVIIKVQYISNISNRRSKQGSKI